MNSVDATGSQTGVTANSVDRTGSQTGQPGAIRQALRTIQPQEGRDSAGAANLMCVSLRWRAWCGASFS